MKQAEPARRSKTGCRSSVKRRDLRLRWANRDIAFAFLDIITIFTTLKTGYV